MTPNQAHITRAQGCVAGSSFLSPVTLPSRNRARARALALVTEKSALAEILPSSGKSCARSAPRGYSSSSPCVGAFFSRGDWFLG